MLIFAGAAFAQNAQFSGQVTDPQNAVVPKAEVRVVNQATRIERRTKTNEVGFYSVPFLNPGRYRIFVQVAGFKTAVSQEVTLVVGQNLVLNVQLRLGSPATTVTVKAGSQLVNTTDASVSTVVDRKFVADLPTNGRSLQSLIFLAPGVAVTTTTSGEQGQFSVNGQRPDANYFTVDGMAANIGSYNFDSFYVQAASGALPGSNIQGGFTNLVSLDALQELQIQTSSFAPEFGRMPGAQILLVTRSGTKDIHGSAFEYIRNEFFDAEDRFAGALGLAKAPVRLHDFGGTLGGPLPLPGGTNKTNTFFFASYEGLRFKLPQTLHTIVPSTASRESATLLATQILGAFPLPNTDQPNLPGGGAFFNAAFGDPTSSNAASFRLDHKFNDKLSTFGRFDYATSIGSSRSFDDLAEVDANGQDTITLTVGSDQVFSPRAQNEIRFNLSRQTGSAFVKLDSFGGAHPPPVSLLFPTSSPDKGDRIVSIDGIDENSIYFKQGHIADNQQRQIQIVDNFSYGVGAHLLRFGADFRFLSPHSAAEDLGANYDWESIQNLNSGSVDFLDYFTSPTNSVLYPTFSFYLQDTWRVNRRLTLTYGTRWEVNPPPTSRGLTTYTACCLENISHLTLSAPNAPFYHTSYTDLAPRLGIAYQIRQEAGQELVLHAGAGIFYDLGQTGFGGMSWPYENFNFLFSQPFPVSPSTFEFPPPDPVPSPSNPASVTMAIPGYKLPRTYHLNTRLEQALGKSQVFSLAYVGALGRNLIRDQVHLNPSPDFDTVHIISNEGFSGYHSLQAQFQRRLSRGLQAEVAYTWSHSIDNASSDTASGIPSRLVNPRIEKGDSDFDLRHHFTGAVTYAVPNLTLGRLGNLLLHNWSLQSVFFSHTSLPITIFADPFSVEPNFPTPRRPNIVTGFPFVIKDRAKPGRRYINPNAFSVPPLAQLQGDLGRNALRLFGAWQIDFSLHRDFVLTKTAKLQFRVEMFNVLNHPNFANPGAGFPGNNFLGFENFGESGAMLNQGGGGGGNSGGINPLFAQGGPRDMQFALRLEF